MTDPLPPSLDEIEAIVLRRRRTRFRVGVGVAGVALLGAAGVAARARTDQAGVAGPAPATTAPGATTTGPAATVTIRPSCNLEWNVDVPAFIADGLVLYDGLADVPTIDELTQIAVEWGVSNLEAKTIVGFGAERGLTDIGDDTDDDLLAQWSRQHPDFAQIVDIAEDWNVAPVTLKMLDALEVPAVTDAVANC